MTQHTIESGVAFATEVDAEVFVQATFIESGQQMHMAIIGTEPVLLIQPEYDADANEVNFLVTAVDLDPEGLVEVLDVLLDAAKLMVSQQAEAQAADDLAELESIPDA
jgi:hypothetical protein